MWQRESRATFISLVCCEGIHDEEVAVGRWSEWGRANLGRPPRRAAFEGAQKALAGLGFSAQFLTPMEAAQALILN